MSDSDRRNQQQGTDVRDGEQDRAMGELIRSAATRHAASPALRRQITRALRAQATTPAPAWRAWRAWLNVGAAFACGALATWLAFTLPIVRDPAERIEVEVVAAHARSLLAAHATDVASSDLHTVKPWLSARLDFSPPVPDLKADGFPLAGGRLDYVAERPVAALLYQRHQHVINVFLWPTAEPALTRARRGTRKGFNTVDWIQGGMQVWIVTDLSNGELNTFSELLRKRITDAPTS